MNVEKKMVLACGHSHRGGNEVLFNSLKTLRTFLKTIENELRSDPLSDSSLSTQLCNVFGAKGVRGIVVYGLGITL